MARALRSLFRSHALARASTAFLAVLGSGCSLDVTGQASFAGAPIEEDGDPSQGDGGDVDPDHSSDGEESPSGDGDGDGGGSGDGDGNGDGDGDGDGDGNAQEDPPPGEVAVFRTTPDGLRRLSQERSLTFEEGHSDAPLVIKMDASQRFQAIDGFGGQVHEAAGSVMATRVDVNTRRSLLRLMFDPQSGAGLSALRMPVGASNYAHGPYTYDESSPDLSDFSVGREELEQIPLMLDVRALQPDLLLFAAPWSPPAWMKSPQSLNGGLVVQRYYPLLAQYLAEFILAYAERGLSVYAISPQNEPYNAPNTIDHPATLMGADAQAEFIAEHLAPLFEMQGIGAKILTWDHNWDDAEAYAGAVLERPQARPHVAGTAVHCYLGDATAQTKLHEHFPDKDVWLTECQADGRYQGFQAELGRAMEVAGAALANWSRTVLLGSLALDQNHGPRFGGCSDCGSFVRVDNQGQALVSGEVYALGHFGRFVKRGAQRIRTTINGPNAANLVHVGFVNPDESRVLVVYNRAQTAQSFTVRQGALALDLKLEAHGVVTLHWSRKEGSIYVGDAVTSASHTDGSTPLVGATDGNPDTRWSSGRAQGGSQWFALDLGVAKTLSWILLDTGDDDGDYPRAFRVQVSNDGAQYRDVASQNGDAGRITVRFEPTEARYVRIVSSGFAANWWSIAELTLGN